MGKDKLRKFAENLTFECFVQPEFQDIFNKNHPLKGNWRREFFGNDNPIVLELGCGKGEYTVELARRYPNKNFIGVDIKGARIWRGAKTATEENLRNVGFLRTRIEFINSFFGEGEISEIWLTFSDPQLRGSHSQKRLTSPRFLERYAKFLSPTGVINLKTDSAHLHHYTRHVIQCNSLVVEECIEDVHVMEQVPELLKIQTAYEKSFVAEGLPITYLRYSLCGKTEFSATPFPPDEEEGDLDMLRRRRTVVEIDPKSGFCFGVVRAIEAAEDFLGEVKTGYSLGEIVHNNTEVRRLEDRGLSVITHQELEKLEPNTTVLVRAHGEPPATFEKLQTLGLRVVDATCPVVASLQEKVKKAWSEMTKINGQVALLGKRGHSEVVGLTGQVDGEVIVLENETDINQIDFERPVTLLSQTTQSLALFHKIKDTIIEKSKVPEQVTVLDTICRQVSGRTPHLKEFARRFGAIIFVSGRNSSNGKVLFEVCRKANPNTVFVENFEDIDPQWIKQFKTVGICGATSTPLWLMQKIVKKISPQSC